MLLYCMQDDGKRAKHLTTTATRPHPYEFYHDERGFNYRMPNLNAALGCGQLEKIGPILASKRLIAERYAHFFSASDYHFVKEPSYGRSNYWLNVIYCPNEKTRNQSLETTNQQGIMTRSVWQLMHRLPMFSNELGSDLSLSELAEAHLVNVPSSAIFRN